MTRNLGANRAVAVLTFCYAGLVGSLVRRRRGSSLAVLGRGVVPLSPAPGEHGDFDVMFLGKDGQAGGDGVNADWGNWQ